MPLTEKTLHQETVYAGRLIRVERIEVVLPNGRPALREVVRHPGAVALLALLDGGARALLVRQYRKPAERAVWEVPAGTLEPGEDPLACARRELIEETGYRSGKLRALRRFYTAPGFCDEVITLFSAENLAPEKNVQRPDDEFLEVAAFDQAKAQRLIERGEICDAKTLLALALWPTLFL